MQVLLILVNNAIEHTFQGTIEIGAILKESVKLDESYSNFNNSRTLQISVEDSGEGIGIKHQQKLLKVLNFLDSSQVKSHTGLLLAANIVKKFNGEI